MKTHAMELRQRIVAAIDAKEGSQREIARRFGVSGSFIVRLLQHRRKTGGLEPSPHGGGRSFSLDADARRRLAAMVRKRPDATLQQLKDFGGFDCTLTTLWRTLRRMGLTRKKKTLRASERDRPDVQTKARAIPTQGAEDRAQTACFPGRDRRRHDDDPGLRLGAARRAGRRLDPEVVEVDDSDRRRRLGRRIRAVGVPRGVRRESVPGLRREGPGPAAASRRRRRARQPGGPRRRGGGPGDQASRR